MLDNVDAALESAIASHEAGDLIVAGEKYLEIAGVKQRDIRTVERPFIPERQSASRRASSREVPNQVRAVGYASPTPQAVTHKVARVTTTSNCIFYSTRRPPFICYVHQAMPPVGNPSAISVGEITKKGTIELGPGLICTPSGNLK